MDVLLPPGWAPPIGYANGIAVTPGRLVFVAGQVGWDAHQRFASEDLAPQFDQALANVIAVRRRRGRAARAHLPDHRLLLRQARLSRRASRTRAHLARADGHGTFRR